MGCLLLLDSGKQTWDTVWEWNAPSENVTAASNTAVSHLSLYGQWTGIECSCSRRFHLLHTSALELLSCFARRHCFDMWWTLRGCYSAQRSVPCRKFCLLNGWWKEKLVDFLLGFFTHTSEKIDYTARSTAWSISFQRAIVLSEARNNYWYSWRIGCLLI